jgi:hypothetical protein
VHLVYSLRSPFLLSFGQIKPSDREVKQMKNLRITVRVEEPDRQKIERLMHDGKFKNMSQVLRRALQEFLKTQ